jgi:hypothetical protein
MTKRQLADQKAAKARNKARRRKETAKEKLYYEDGVLTPWKRIVAERQRVTRARKVAKVHKGNPQSWLDEKIPAAICGRMFTHKLVVSHINGDVTCENCLVVLSNNKWDRARA